MTLFPTYRLKRISEHPRYFFLQRLGDGDMHFITKHFFVLLEHPVGFFGSQNLHLLVKFNPLFLPVSDIATVRMFPELVLQKNDGRFDLAQILIFGRQVLDVGKGQLPSYGSLVYEFSALFQYFLIPGSVF